MLCLISPLRLSTYQGDRGPTNSIQNHSHPTQIPVLFLGSVIHPQRKNESWPHIAGKTLNCHRLIPTSSSPPPLEDSEHISCVSWCPPNTSTRSVALHLSFLSPWPGREEDRGTKWHRVDACEPFDLLLLLSSPPTSRQGWRRSPPSS